MHFVCTDNRCQSETRRRKRRWSGEQSALRAPTGSTVPYCDPPPHPPFLSCFFFNAEQTQSRPHEFGSLRRLIPRAQKRWMQRGGEERSEWKESAPHDAFERRSLLHYLCCLSRMFNRPDPQTTSPNSLLNQVSFLTLISNAAQDGGQ